MAYSTWNDYKKEWGLEITEHPVRSPEVAIPLIEMGDICHEVRSCIDAAIQDVFTDDDGDVVNAFWISDYLDKEETQPIHPETKQIIDNLLKRKQDDCFVIGGDRLEEELHELLLFGNCFLEIGVGEDSNGEYYVERLLKLPTWEMFRIESDQGVLQKFSQRKYLARNEESSIDFIPKKIIHTRYTKKGLYGESPFKPSIPYWENLKEAVLNLVIACRSAAIVPTVHRYPKSFSPKKQKEYREYVEQREKIEKIITNWFIEPEMEILKLTNTNPSLTPLLEDVNHWRSMMFLPGMPPYFFQGVKSQKARDISGGPDRRYSRLRQHWCSLLSSIIRRVIETEIILKKGQAWFDKHGSYRIQWNKLVLEQTSTRNPDELTGINNRGNDAEDEE